MSCGFIIHEKHTSKHQITVHCHIGHFLNFVCTYFLKTSHDMGWFNLVFKKLQRGSPISFTLDGAFLRFNLIKEFCTETASTEFCDTLQSIIIVIIILTVWTIELYPFRKIVLNQFHWIYRRSVWITSETNSMK